MIFSSLHKYVDFNVSKGLIFLVILMGYLARDLNHCSPHWYCQWLMGVPPWLEPMEMILGSKKAAVGSEVGHWNSSQGEIRDRANGLKNCRTRSNKGFQFSHQLSKMTRYMVVLCATFFPLKFSSMFWIVGRNDLPCQRLFRESFFSLWWLLSWCMSGLPGCGYRSWWHLVCWSVVRWEALEMWDWRTFMKWSDTSGGTSSNSYL